MKATVIAVLLASTLGVRAQLLFPAKWSYKLSKETVAVGDEIDLLFMVAIDDSWYVYATDFVPTEDFGPVPTKFRFEPHPSYELVGEVISKDAKEKTDELLELTFRYMDQSPAVFIQKVKILSKDPVIKGQYEYQVCTLVDGKCIPGDGEFEFTGLRVSVPGESLKSKKDGSSGSH